MWLLLVTIAFAQMQTRRFEVRWRDGSPRISFDARDLADARAREDIDGGIARRIRVTTQAFAEGRSTPIATRTFDCQIRSGVWQRGYFVRLGNREYSFEHINGAIARCLRVSDLRVGTADDYRSARSEEIYFAVRAEYRPMTAEQCRQMLRSSASGGGALNGLVVNIMQRRICRADRAVDFRSQLLRCPQ